MQPVSYCALSLTQYIISVTTFETGIMAWPSNLPYRIHADLKFPGVPITGKKEMQVQRMNYSNIQLQPQARDIGPRTPHSSLFRIEMSTGPGSLQNVEVIRRLAFPFAPEQQRAFLR